MTDPRLHIRPPEWSKDVNAQILAPTVTPDGVAIMRDAGIVSDITPDALAAVAGLCRSSAWSATEEAMSFAR
jgi:hypothetical protein